jgi:alpha-galactosidase
MYVDEQKSKAIVFHYLVSNRYKSGSTALVKFNGLHPQKQYRVQEINVYPDAKSSLAADAVFYGDYLKQVGFNPDVHARRTSVVLEVREVKVLQLL